MKKLFLFFLSISFMFLSPYVVFAKSSSYDLYIGNTKMGSSDTVYYAPNSNVSMWLRPPSNSTVDYDTPQYGYIAICSAVATDPNNYITTVSSSLLEDITVVNSTVGCTIPTVNFYQNTSRVVYFTFRTSNAWDCGVGSGVCQFSSSNGSAGLTFFQGGSNVYSYVGYGLSYTPFNFNDTVDPTVSQNDTIINQNDTIINQNTQINNSINDSNVDDPSSSINGFQDKLATNGVITQLVTLPVTLFTKVLNSVNGTCSSYNLGSLFGTDLILPCINIQSFLGSTLWSVIDVLISGLFVYAISRKFIKVFENLSSMKDGDVISD